MTNNKQTKYREILLNSPKGQSKFAIMRISSKMKDIKTSKDDKLKGKMHKKRNENNRNKSTADVKREEEKKEKKKERKKEKKIKKCESVETKNY